MGGAAPFRRSKTRRQARLDQAGVYFLPRCLLPASVFGSESEFTCTARLRNVPASAASFFILKSIMFILSGARWLTGGCYCRRRRTSAAAAASVLPPFVRCRPRRQRRLHCLKWVVSGSAGLGRAVRNRQLIGWASEWAGPSVAWPAEEGGGCGVVGMSQKVLPIRRPYKAASAMTSEGITSQRWRSFPPVPEYPGASGVIRSRGGCVYMLKILFEGTTQFGWKRPPERSLLVPGLVGFVRWDLFLLLNCFCSHAMGRNNDRSGFCGDYGLRDHLSTTITFLTHFVALPFWDQSSSPPRKGVIGGCCAFSTLGQGI